MNDCIREAARLNDEATLLLAYGSLSEAFRTYKAALSILNNVSMPSQSSGSSQNLISHQQNNAIKVKPTVINCLDREQDGCQVYNRPFSFIPDLTSVNIPFLCAIVMFNMSLMVHLSRKGGPKDTRDCKALHLYNVTLSLLDEAASFGSDYKALRLATLNNMALVHYDLCQYKETRNLLNAVIELVTFGEEMSSFFCQDEIGMFLLNGMFLGKVSNCAPCA